MHNRIRVFSNEDVERASDGRKRYGLRRYLDFSINQVCAFHKGRGSRCSDECVS